MSRWWIHLKHPGGETSVSFHGTREEADARAAQYIGKPASWNCTKEPHAPNLWDTYAAWRGEESVPLRETGD